jgi:hypothetical protein
MTFDDLVLLVKQVLSKVMDISTLTWREKDNEHLTETWVYTKTLSIEGYNFLRASLLIGGVKLKEQTVSIYSDNRVLIDIVENHETNRIYVGLQKHDTYFWLSKS